MKRLIHSFALLLAAWLLVTGHAQATAAPRVSTVLILPDGVEGVDLLLSNAADALRKLNVGITEFDDATIAGFDLEAALECLGDEDAEDCSDVTNMVPAEWVLLLRIRRVSENPDSDQSVVAKLYSATSADLLQVEQRVCERCSSSERLAGVIRDLVGEMANKQLAEKARDTFLDVQSNPKGALLSIDGTVVGPTGQSYRVSPGEHTIKLQYKGHRMASQKVSVGANEHKALTVSLDPLPKPDGTRRMLGWVSIGVGAAVLATGATFIAIHQDVPGADEPRIADRRNSKGLGIAGVATGAVLLGVGTALILTAKDVPDDDAVSFSAGPTSSGFAFGFSGQF
tara:strand:- start:355 stop:1377 length:1023 start_codon:yes stop_codon:yes gene_type:complete